MAGIPGDLLPESSVAAGFYRQETGNLTTHFLVRTLFVQRKRRAEAEFSLLHPDLACLFDSTVNRHYRPFQGCLIDKNNTRCKVTFTHECPHGKGNKSLLCMSSILARQSYKEVEGSLVLFYVCLFILVVEADGPTHVGREINQSL